MKNVRQDLSIFKRVEQANNLSIRTNRYLKMHQHDTYRVYLVARNLRHLYELKKNYKGFNLMIGFLPHDKRDGKPFKCSEVNGSWLPHIYCHSGINTPLPKDTCFNPILRVKGATSSVVALDITEDFIAKYSQIGMCLLHDSEHQFVTNKTGKSRQCKICKKKFKLVTRMIPKRDWVEIKSSPKSKRV